MSQLPTDERVQETKQRRRTAPWLLGGLVLLLLLTLVALQAFGVWTVLPRDANSDTLIIYALSSLNFAAFVVFAFILMRSLLKLRRERKERQLGSKIKTRLIVSFISLSLLPITAMALFSYLFFNRTLEKWFYGGPQEIIREATQLERKAVANQTQRLHETAQMLATVIEAQPAANYEQTLARLISNGNLAAIEIINADGQVIARRDAQLPADEESELNQALKLAYATKGTDESLSNGRGFDAALVPLSDNRM